MTLSVLQQPRHRRIELLRGRDDDAAAAGRSSAASLLRVRGCWMPSNSVAASVSLICSSSSLRSMMISTVGSPSPTRSSLRAAKTIVSDLPEPGGVPDDAALQLAVEHALHELVRGAVLVGASELLDCDALARLEDDEVDREVDERVRMKRAEPDEHLVVGVGDGVRPRVAPLVVAVEVLQSGGTDAEAQAVAAADDAGLGYELRDVVPVAGPVAGGDVERLVGVLVLDGSERDAVDQADDVKARLAAAAGADGELLGRPRRSCGRGQRSR